jgi:HAD superfamily hydrolase (TIGR01662 family)
VAVSRRKDGETRRPKPKGRFKVLWVREPYLSQILAGRKTIEVRVGYDNIRRLQPGDRLKLNDRHLAGVRRVGRYSSFEELLAHEDATAIAPDLSADELLGALRELYPSEKESMGVVALEVAPRRYDAVLLDMGSTLVYSDPPEMVIIHAALQDVGIERSVEETRAAAEGVSGEYYRDAATLTFAATPEHDHGTQLDLMRAFLEHLGISVGDEELAAYEGMVDSRLSRPGALCAFPEVPDVLAALRDEDYRLGIVSNWSWNLRDQVAQVGLDRFFEIAWASAYAGCRKPHPGIFHQAMLQMDLRAGRTLYVGDSYEHDVVGARSAGLDAVLLDRRRSAGERDCPVISDLWGLFDLLGE